MIQPCLFDRSCPSGQLSLRPNNKIIKADKSGNKAAAAAGHSRTQQDATGRNRTQQPTAQITEFKAGRRDGSGRQQLTAQNPET